MQNYKFEREVKNRADLKKPFKAPKEPRCAAVQLEAPATHFPEHKNVRA